jgi:hypothetical protein
MSSTSPCPKDNILIQNCGRNNMTLRIEIVMSLPKPVFISWWME